jgi:predicted thioesterase
MEPGIQGRITLLVTPELTAKAVGSGDLPVFATPSMIAAMEQAAYQSVAPYLEPGQGTVGTLMEVKHTAATPVGMEVTCETELIEIDRKLLVFAVRAYDKQGSIGEGTHERFIIDNERFLSRAEAKKQ